MSKFIESFEKVAFNGIKKVKDTFTRVIKNVDAGVKTAPNIQKATNVSKAIRNVGSQDLGKMEKARKLSAHMDKMLKAGIPKETIQARMKAHYAKKALK